MSGEGEVPATLTPHQTLPTWALQPPSVRQQKGAPPELGPLTSDPASFPKMSDNRTLLFQNCFMTLSESDPLNVLEGHGMAHCEGGDLSRAGPLERAAAVTVRMTTPTMPRGQHPPAPPSLPPCSPHLQCAALGTEPGSCRGGDRHSACLCVYRLPFFVQIHF